MYKNDLYPITEHNFSELNGQYSNHPYKDIDLNGTTIISNPETYCLIHQFLDYDVAQVTACSDLDFEIAVQKNQSNYSIQFNYFNTKDELQKMNVTAEISKGFLVLDNKNFSVKGIPFLLGGTEKNKMRIGLDQTKNLIVENFHDKTYHILLYTNGTGKNVDAKVYKKN